MASGGNRLASDPTHGSVELESDNERLLFVKRKWPSRFAVFVAIDPSMARNLERLQHYVARGADGLVLYVRDGGQAAAGDSFHVMPLSDGRMEPVWAWAEEIQLPIALHVNLRLHRREIVAVLERHPYLRVNIPHFGLSMDTRQHLSQLGHLLDRYPYVFTDLSFGAPQFQVDGFESLVSRRSITRAFFERYRNKILFGADVPIFEARNTIFIERSLTSYLRLLEDARWRFFAKPDSVMLGLGLSDETLSWIYERSPANWLLLNTDGALPDRSKGWPIPGVVVPPRPRLKDFPVDMIRDRRGSTGSRLSK